MGDRDIRVSDEYERLMRMTAWLRECFEGEVNGALGTREQISIDDKTVRKWKELCACYEKLVDAKVKLDKHEKELEKRKLTPEQELEACRQLVRSMAREDRTAFLQAELARDTPPNPFV